MITRTFGSHPRKSDAVTIKIVGIGGGGSNALDRMVLDGLEHVRLVSVNTDTQSLVSSVASEKIQLGRTTTHGLGTGGDPDLGAAATEEAADDIRRTFENVSMAFICAGLGGGTGSGAAPKVAALAREQGALVIAFVTLPFSFEGKRRRDQADASLAALRDSADVVFYFENDKMGDSVPSKAGIHQAFAATDQTLSQSVKAISNLFTKPGLIRIGFDDLSAALRNHHASSVFGYGEADGENRVHDALARALKNPLMDRGRLLSEAQNVLVNVAGGPELTLNEVQILMDELGKHLHENAQVLFGTVVDPKFSGKVSVTIISSIGDAKPVRQILPTRVQSVQSVPKETERPIQREPVEKANIVEELQLPIEPVIHKTEPTPEPEELPELISAVAQANEIQEETTEPVEKPVPVGRSRQFAFPTSTAPILQTPASATKKANPEARQETLQFEPVTRGRFDKSEPTIVDGQDLDIPTFMRLNVKVK